MKLCFIQIPRTGCTTLGHYFEKHNPNDIKVIGHLDIDRGSLPQIYFTNLSQYFVFGFVRNPWDFWVSNYFAQKTNGYIPNIFTFKDFVKTANDLIFGSKCKETFSQSGYYNRLLYYDRRRHTNEPSWSYYSTGTFIANYIGKYETQDEDLEIVEKKTGIKLPRMSQLPMLGKTEREHYSHYYDEETKQMVREIETNIIMVYGYEFQNQ